MAKRVRAPAASGNRTKGSKRKQGERQGAEAKRRKAASVEPGEASAVPPASTATERDEPPDFSPLEAIPVADLLRVDRRFANEAAVSWFRARYPPPVFPHPSAPPSPPPYRPTNEELQRAREIVETVGAALLVGRELQWERLLRAHEVLFATDSRDLKIAACVRAIRNAVRVAREPRHLNVAEGLILALARYEPAFAALKAQQVRIELERTQPHEAVKKGGRGRMGPLGLASILTVSVGAFGVERTDDLRDVKKMLDSAVRRAEQPSKRPRKS